MKRLLIGLYMIFSLSLLEAAQPYESIWTSLLKTHTKIDTKHRIKSVLVDYSGLRKSQNFIMLVRQLESTKLSSLSTPEDKLAFWINAYNIGAVKMVVNHKPVQSIKDIGTLTRPVWDKPILFIEDKPYSLGHIEHKILRLMNEPRIHFAIVCASMSCPDLRQEAYSGKVLNAQLDDQVKHFLSNHRKGYKYNSSTKVIRYSRLFKWFKEDFSSLGGVDSFVNKHTSQQLEVGSTLYLPYNWKLNSY